MPQIVQSLPYVAWVLLAALALGSFGLVALTARLSDATRGYLAFTSFCAGLLALLALLTDWGLPAPADLVIERASPAMDALRQAGLGVFAAATFAYALVVRRRLTATALAEVAAVGAAATVIAAAAFGWQRPDDAVPLLVQLTALAGVAGGSLAAIVLGHWYLVTPGISARPLLVQSRAVFWLLALQVLLFVTWTTLGGGPGRVPFSAFATGTGTTLLVALRLVVTLLFPLLLAWMAGRTAATRSMESATGLLYINLAAVMAGTIGAAALYLSAGLLV